jgi:hypothetical protein
MMISIVLQSANTATVTRTPGWLAHHLLGHQESTVEVWSSCPKATATWVDTRYAWIYEDGREVEDEVADAIDRAMTMRALQERRERLVRK